MKKATLFFAVIILSSVLYSCGSLTYVTDVWNKQGFNGKKFNKVAVFAVAKENVLARRLIEDAVVKELGANGVSAIVTYDVFPQDTFDKDKDGKVDNSKDAEELIKAKTKELNVDGVLVLNLKDIKNDRKYVPGVPNYIPTYYYAPYYNYYFMSYDRVYSQGYYVKNTDVYFESCLYDINQSELLYSVLSETVNPTSLGDFTKSYSKALAKTLVDQKVLLK